MNFKRMIGLVCIAVGIALLIVASQSIDTFGEKVSQQFSGSYSDATMRNLIAGIVLTVVGGCLAVFCRKR